MTPLTSDQEALLRGRELEVAEIADYCRHKKLAVITSPPGMGLTSLLEAGVAPALKREGFIVITYREWQGTSFAIHLCEAVEMAVREQCQSWVSGRGDSLPAILHQIRELSGKPVAVLFDQFEDYLRCQAKTALADSFDAELAQAISRRDASFVIGMHTYAVQSFERLKPLIPNLLGNRLELQPLTPEAAREAVAAEARAACMEATPEAIEALVTAPILLRQEGKVHPFFLKVASGQLLEAATRVQAPAVDLAMINARGGVERVIFESLDANISDLNPTHVDLLFHWCNILISKETRRVAITEKGLTEYAGKLNRFVVSLLPIVTGTHLMRPVETPEGIRYEIARECMTPILKDWWERHEAVITARRRAAFRTRSISLAVTCIVAMYLVWIILSWKDAS